MPRVLEIIAMLPQSYAIPDVAQPTIKAIAAARIPRRVCTRDIPGIIAHRAVLTKEVPVN
jgi:hypothetical protein